MKAICEAEYVCPMCGGENINIAQDWFKDGKWYYRVICNDCRAHWDAYMSLKLSDVYLSNEENNNKKIKKTDTCCPLCGSNNITIDTDCEKDLLSCDCVFLLNCNSCGAEAELFYDAQFEGNTHIYDTHRHKVKDYEKGA